MAHQDPTWTTIPNFEGHQVNASGEIRIIATGRVLKGSTNQTGVRYVSIRNTTERRYQNVAISVIVASTFCEGQSAQTNTVLHLNGDTEDCHASNLMWATRFHAIQYHQEINKIRRASRRRIQDETGRIYRSVVDAAKNTGCLPSAIEYAVDYNDTLAVGTHLNFTHKIFPGGHIFRSA